ncbi:FMN-binding negative transcriptional regulator [Microbacterium sp. K21]|uniref:FMN-binding negative transcriptional regulator n=1 Tax=Microbacterium sp. K21 TaxID=2305448 RepID=UPI001F0FB45D|nr:FMN-binding negative transcriptional regulator [Microbacterium sp. K21]
MRHTPRYLMTDPDEVKRLIRGNPWATFVSPASGGLVASHYPALLMEDDDDIVIASHFGRPDEQLHELGRHEVLVIIQGPHDYVSPTLYAPGDLVPTWNHVTAHLYGIPEILSEEENYAMLSRLTDHPLRHIPTHTAQRRPIRVRDLLQSLQGVVSDRCELLPIDRDRLHLAVGIVRVRRHRRRTTGRSRGDLRHTPGSRVVCGRGHRAPHIRVAHGPTE